MNPIAQRKREVRLIRLAFLLAVLLCILCVMAMAVGCTSSVKGGQSQHQTKGIVINIRPTVEGADITYTDNTERVATTQPSVTTNAAALPKLGPAGEGEIGSVSFDQVKRNFPNAWPLALILVAAGVGCWLFGNRLGAIACGACAVLTLLWPQFMVFLAIAAVAMCIWSAWGRIKDLVRGTQAALATMPLAEQQRIKSVMETEHDKPTKRAVAGVKSP